LIAATTVLMALFSRPSRIYSKSTRRRSRRLIDAIHAAFAVVGMQLAMDKGRPTVGVVFIGLSTAPQACCETSSRDVPSLRPGHLPCSRS
jgi:uncharacterized membrane protein YeiH